MDLHTSRCLICQRPLPAPPRPGSEFAWDDFRCRTCGPYSVLVTGCDSLRAKDDGSPWSEDERALISGMVRERVIHHAPPPRFGWRQRRAQGPDDDYPEDLLAAAPKTFRDKADRTLLNLARMGRPGEPVTLKWTTDVSVAYARDNGELGIVLQYLQTQQYLDRVAETQYDVTVRLTGSGWTRVQEAKPATAENQMVPTLLVAETQPNAECRASTRSKSPTVFVSYSWDSDELKAWTKKLAARLRRDGVDAKLDQWETAPGDQLPEFMERSVRGSDFVLMICTPKYKAKADGRQGGVGYEGDIITGELYANRDHRKFIPILREGDWNSSFPSWMSGKCGIDLRGEPYSEEEYRKLVDTLQGKREPPPPIGTVPE